MSVVESMVLGTPVLTYNCSQGVADLQSATPKCFLIQVLEN